MERGLQESLSIGQIVIILDQLELAMRKNAEYSGMFLFLFFLNLCLFKSEEIQSL